MAGVDDRVGVRRDPVADRVVVGRVHDDPARRRSGCQSARGPGSDGAPHARPEVKNSPKSGLGRVRGVVGSVGIELGAGRARTGRPPPVTPVPVLARGGSRSPRRPAAVAAVAVGASGPRLVEVDDRAPRGRPAPEADAGQRELPLLRLPVLDERTAPRRIDAASSTTGSLPEHPPERGPPTGPGAANTASHGRSRSVVTTAATPSARRTRSRSPRPPRAIGAPGRARPLGQVADRLHRVGPAAAALVQDGLAPSASPVRPGHKRYSRHCPRRSPARSS